VGPEGVERGTANRGDVANCSLAARDPGAGGHQSCLLLTWRACRTTLTNLPAFRATYVAIPAGRFTQEWAGRFATITDAVSRPRYPQQTKDTRRVRTNDFRRSDRGPGQGGVARSSAVGSGDERAAAGQSQLPVVEGSATPSPGVAPGEVTGHLGSSSPCIASMMSRAPKALP
jgi:hypothetical protein